jgi:predicted DCC family thiol-disulfide oxidoreductase YuxK
MNAPALTLFYDGQCPFCAAEMARLRGWNHEGQLGFVDISQPDFDPQSLGVTMAALDRELHSQKSSGEILVGIDSMLAAYTLVDKSWLVFPLRIKPLRPLLANLYRTFARNRYRFSSLLGYKPIARCNDGVCSHTGNPFLDQ